MDESARIHWQNNVHHQWWRDSGLRKNVLSVVLLYGASFQSGYDQSLFNSLLALPAWNRSFNHPSGSKLGLMAAYVSFGYMLIVPVVHLLVDGLGRKKAIFFGCLISIAGGFLCTFSRSEFVFNSGRFVTGIGHPILQFGSMCLVNELVHPRLRGISSALSMSSFCVGGLVNVWMAFFCLRWGNSDWQWRFITLAQSIALLAFLVGLCFIPESPRWLVCQGRQNEALRILAKYHANGDTDDELVQQEFHEITTRIQQDIDAGNIRWRNLLQSAGNRRRMLVLTLAVSGTLVLGSGIARNYSTIVLKSLGIKDPARITAINGGLGFWYTIWTTAGALSADKVGRRTLYIGSTIGMLLSLCVITGLSATFENYTNSTSIAIGVLASFCVFTAFHQAGWTALYSLYIIEILPFSVRGKALNWANLIQTSSVLLTNFLDPIALSAIQWKYYLVFIGLEVIYLGLVWLFFMETKGGTIEQASVVFDRGPAGPTIPGEHNLELAVPAIQRNSAYRNILTDKDCVVGNDSN
ncbi:general substrate transporter [Lentinula edodes]|uniref:General substrate transporter n=1 Tax=Lentinula lateritia TaxID=40482 RepID=A0A9W9A263_9AGAR|nr:general substrate transporter [Lentinula edodes]